MCVGLCQKSQQKIQKLPGAEKVLKIPPQFQNGVISTAASTGLVATLSYRIRRYGDPPVHTQITLTFKAADCKGLVTVFSNLKKCKTLIAIPGCEASCSCSLVSNPIFKHLHRQSVAFKDIPTSLLPIPLFGPNHGESPPICFYFCGWLLHSHFKTGCNVKTNHEISEECPSTKTREGKKEQHTAKENQYSYKEG